jgi:hypothetical protein
MHDSGTASVVPCPGERRRSRQATAEQGPAGSAWTMTYRESAVGCGPSSEAMEPDFDRRLRHPPVWEVH